MNEVAAGVEEVPVLIVGGSMVGLSAALFLAHHGVPALAVERHGGTAIHPRAGHFHLRTLELLRSADLEDAVRRVSEAQFFPNGGINAVETVAGGETASYIADLNAGVEEFSPSRRLFVAQHALEPLLRARAEELGARLSYSTLVVSLDDDGDGVTAVLRDLATGADRTVRARYVVAADGSRSPVRRRLGIGMHGYGLLSHSVTIYFRADCSKLLEGGNQGVIYVFNDRLRGFFRFDRSGTSGFLAVNTLGDPREPGALDVTADLTTEGARELVRAAIGVPDIAVEVDDVAPWDATADLADRYRAGRILLAGDAVHPLPPNGGYGGNTGVQDAHNLAWKLAAVLGGTAGDALLDSYEAERRPIGRLTIEQAYTRYARRVVPELAGDEELPPLVDDLSMEIGYRYRSNAIVAEGDDDGALTEHPSTARGRPGSRAPHVVLARDGVRLSTLDLFGQGYVLLAGPQGAAWRRAAAQAAAATEVPIDVHVAGAGADADVEDAAGRLPAAYGLERDGAALVRPDGFVAWRSAGAVDGPAETLERVLRSTLGVRSRAASAA
ncbi:FAD-dependent monooxygenase [Capillimicrobium parvum]|uniref:4-methyl-5-nitrocatechol 5-monooxygenase n=1 Tax=Capillimicrobium parvum TaxID=2884022 RepID=A0A9E6XY80_9ACTN|nr:FAD-dependent monooxygenase [Capillimicrobium parvum]UGS36400.1 4-methyl-5-nitrocatechol 5-monooxygenase [Capillimicrobium parvum]